MTTDVAQRQEDNRRDHLAGIVTGDLINAGAVFCRPTAPIMRYDHAAQKMVSDPWWDENNERSKGYGHGFAVLVMAMESVSTQP